MIRHSYHLRTITQSLSAIRHPFATVFCPHRRRPPIPGATRANPPLRTISSTDCGLGNDLNPLPPHSHHRISRPGTPFSTGANPSARTGPELVTKHTTPSIRSHFVWSTNTMLYAHHSNRFANGETQTTLPSPQKCTGNSRRPLRNSFHSPTPLQSRPIHTFPTTE